MNQLSKNIDHIAAMEGITAITVWDPQGLMHHRPTGGTEHVGLHVELRRLHDKLDGKPLRLVVDKTTVVVGTFGEEVAVVQWPTGHIIAKSINRSMRRSARRDPQRVVAKPSAAPGGVAPGGGVGHG